MFGFTTGTLPGQTNSDSTNLLTLLPPYNELPPTFWESHKKAVWIAVVAVILFGGLAAWLGLRRKPKPVLPPDVQARNALGALRQQAEDGALLSRVSQILQEYFSAAFHFPPGELTTAEFIRALSNHEQIHPELGAAVGDFLNRCDRQKFSPAKSEASLDAVARALALVQQAENHRAHKTSLPVA